MADARAPVVRLGRVESLATGEGLWLASGRGPDGRRVGMVVPVATPVYPEPPRGMALRELRVEPLATGGAARWRQQFAWGASISRELRTRLGLPPEECK